MDYVEDFYKANTRRANCSVRPYPATYVYNRGVRGAFAYRFGKLDNKLSRPKRSIGDEDQKAGNGDISQGGN